MFSTFVSAFDRGGMFFGGRMDSGKSFLKKCFKKFGSRV